MREALKKLAVILITFTSWGGVQIADSNGIWIVVFAILLTICGPWTAWIAFTEAIEGD